MSKPGAKRRCWFAGLAVAGTLALGGGAALAQPRAGSALNAAQLVATLHHVNQMEITAGQMAQQNGAAPAVKDLGRTLVLDHQAADDQITNYARSKGMSLDDVPARVRKAQQAMRSEMDKLQKMSGPTFDHRFALDMATGHAKVIALVDASRPAVTDEGLVVLLDKLEPTLRKHRQLAENILNHNAGAASNAGSRSGVVQGRRGPSR